MVLRPADVRDPIGLRQPDARSCGATSAVVARMQADPAYAAAIRPRFAVEVLSTHRRLTRVRLRGSWQLPWPRALGTPPWALARELGALTGVRHRTRLVRWRRAPLAGVGPGALYVGDRWLPRHVVLMLDDARGYDPATGRVVALASGPARPLSFGRWRIAWFVVTPRSRRSGPRIRA